VVQKDTITWPKYSNATPVAEHHPFRNPAVLQISKMQKKNMNFLRVFNSQGEHHDHDDVLSSSLHRIGPRSSRRTQYVSTTLVYSTIIVIITVLSHCWCTQALSLERQAEHRLQDLDQIVPFRSPRGITQQPRAELTETSDIWGKQKANQQGAGQGGQNSQQLEDIGAVVHDVEPGSVGVAGPDVSAEERPEIAQNPNVFGGLRA
jgi:hypothetical protein